MNKGKITISRPCSSREDEVVSITIQDEDAKVQFVEVEVSLANMMQAITGLGNVPCEFVTRGLESVGKVREAKSLEFEIGCESWRMDKDMAYAKAREACPVGWIASEYFGSKDSFFSRDGKNYARTTIVRWVAK